MADQLCRVCDGMAWIVCHCELYTVGWKVVFLTVIFAIKIDR